MQLSLLYRHYNNVIIPALETMVCKSNTPVFVRLWNNIFMNELIKFLRSFESCHRNKEIFSLVI